MPSSVHLRRILQPALAAVLMLLPTSAALVAAQPAPMHRAGQAARQPMAGPRQTAPKQNQEHLPQWMDRHSNLSPEEQQRALQNEPGFRDLPQQTQQRMLDRLNQLNKLTPEQRQRIVDRNEQIEHLTPQQRQQVSGALGQWRGLPEDRRRIVARAFRGLREMPEPQRQALMNSDRFRNQFSEQERNTISGLLAVEPYIPVQHPNDSPSVGK
jgi:Protein of unknown function (DUF3106)